MSNIGTNLISLFLCYLIYKLFKIYFKVWALPNGPIPWPLVGNLLGNFGELMILRTLKLIQT